MECLAPNRVYHDPAYQWLSIGGIIIAWFTPNGSRARGDGPGCERTSLGRLQIKLDRKSNQRREPFVALAPAI